MSAFRKSNLLVALVLSGLSAAFIPSAEAAIVVQYGVPAHAMTFGAGRRHMPTLVMAGSMNLSNTSYHIGRSRAWREHDHGMAVSYGRVMPYATIGGAGEVVSDRQWQTRQHVARANAYRLSR